MASTSEEGKPRDMTYCFPSAGNHLLTHLQPFQPTPEIYNLASGVDMIGFPPKNLHNHSTAGFGLAAISGASNEALMASSYQHYRSLIVDGDDPSLRCVFSCEGNERPSQGLSLSLTSSDPSTIALQPFELRHHDDLRFGPSSSRSVNFEHPLPPGYSYVKNSKYLGPAQELLSEFCNLGINQLKMKQSQKKSSEPTADEEKQPPPIFSLNLLELQRRKTKLLQMLDEVDRRYKHYCDQMKCVTSSFEAVAGGGSAAAYSALAVKATSRHFRSLRDSIVNEIKATKRGMGEKDAATAGLGETPRLRLLDQTLRQQKARQQMNTMENHPWRPQRGLPERSVSVLRAWLFEHFLHPYPSDVDKHILARQTGLSRSQVSNWFINARVRLWKPMVEEMYLEELKEKSTADIDEHNQTPDTKPSHEQLVRRDSECLSSIINNDTKKGKTLQNEQRHFSSSYGAMELDFSSYSTSSVSLTLGLHQRCEGEGEGGGVSLAFAAPAQSSLFYSRDQNQMEECQTAPFSLLDSENQSLQYRNLMGAQLLHDLAG
ncbi:homeobox protein BEL1 homolog [Salvia splendens]|uniref:homeobox protein BEL1 homolog n=1 Tax=Salvia splendens TaxID=180675 RepID=UPI001C260856|nr:homeobox protein BEL1 homolog [Salvia splendens]XP_042031410.1 homeobox protein BEL1 homolog [Salvia splendens]XP_042031411.1 homeobox protein BEL1 homolog [Salvia splendens]XP_042031412.1 homeobox protein BEL1 homolog [Salvia splendens]